MNIAVPLDKQAFEQHINRPEFRLAKYERRWEILTVEWPNVFVRIYAEYRDGAPGYFDFRFDCVGYPNALPTAIPWDHSISQPLAFARWPKGRSHIPSIFNPSWESGRSLYLPCDRLAIKSHPDWATRYPHWLWKADSGLSHYIRIIHGLLNSPDYTGIRGA
jgi:hypothetical protein